MKRWMNAAVAMWFSVNAHAADGIWTNQIGGVWSNADNWAAGIPADGVGTTADFATRTLSRSMEIRDPAARTLGRLVFDDCGGTYPWALNDRAGDGMPSGEPLTLTLPSAQPEIAVSNTTVYLSKRLEGTEGLLKTGPGALYVLTNAAYSGLTEVREGLLSFGWPGASTFPVIVARYTFDDASHLGKDSSGNGNDLDVYGTGSVVYAASGYHGGGALFDGGSYLYRAVPQGFPSGDESFSMAVWVRPASTEKKSILGWGNFSAKRGCTGLQIDAPGTSVTHYIYDGTYNLTVSASGLQSDWTHLAISYDSVSKTRRLYVNGKFISRKDTPVLDIPAQNMMIGCALNDLRFIGRMDEVTVMKGVLTELQVNQLMAGDTPFSGGGATLPAGSALAVGTYGTLAFLQSASVGTCSGGGVLRFDGGSNLMTLAATTGTNFDGWVAGNVGLRVETAPDIVTTLTGGHTYTGRTEVADGKLVLRQADDGLDAHVVAHSTFDDASNLGGDVSGHGNHLVPQRDSRGPIAWTANGKFGGACCFTNRNFLKAVGGFAGISTGNVPFTVAAWVNFDEAAPTNSAVFSWRLGGIYGLALIDGRTRLTTYTGASLPSGMDLLTGDAPDGWHHLAFMYDPAPTSPLANIRVFVDGLCIGGMNNTLTGTAEDCNIGTCRDVLGTEFLGQLDDFVVLDRADPEDVPRLMRGVGQPQAKRLRGVVARYRFDDAADLGCDGSYYMNDLTAQNDVNGPLSWSSEGVFGGALSVTNWNYLRLTGVDNDPVPALRIAEGGAFTLAFWCNPATNCPSLGTFFWMGDPTAGQNCFQMRFQSAFNKIGFGPRDIDGVNFSNKIVTVETDLSAGDSPEGWHHFAVTYDPDGGSHRYAFYLDGALAAGWRGCAMPAAMSPYFYLGAGKSLSEDKRFQGLMDDFVMLNRAVPPSEIPFLMNGGGLDDGYGVLPKETDVSVDVGAGLALQNLGQTVASLSGAGAVELARSFLRIDGGTTGALSSVLSGTGSVFVANGSVQTLAGTDAAFVGELCATNAVLSVVGATGTGTTVRVQPGGLFGGSGTLSGAVVVEAGGTLQSRFGEAELTFAGGLTLAAGAGFRFSAEMAGVGNLVVAGTLTLPENGFVEASLPAGAKGQYVLIRADALTGNTALSGWRVTLDPALSGGTDVRLKTVDRAIVLSVAPRGTLISVL